MLRTSSGERVGFVIGKSASYWLLHRLGLKPADTQLTLAERDCLERHALGRKSLLEIGVMHGASTALLRKSMAADGILTGIDPHLRGRLGVSFERWIAERELRSHPRGRVELLREFSHDALSGWSRPIDFLFIDGDHSWGGIDRDWRGFASFVKAEGVVLLHDSRSVSWREDADSVRYTQTVILPDRRFRVVEEVDSLTVLERRKEA
jgi:predicted O-methyltransferase YrrM